MRLIALALICVVLSGCDSSPTDATGRYNLPEELKDCSIFYVGSLTIVRCPSSSVTTSYMQGKIKETVVTIDGKEYVEKEMNK